MKTECTPQSAQFQPSGNREIRAAFDGGSISSDGGALLLREVEKKTGILKFFSSCLEDQRDPSRTLHPAADLLAQRIYAIALGYEDLNDHDELRRDPLMGLLLDKPLQGNSTPLLAGKSTLNRFELTRPESASTDRYKKVILHQDKVDQALVDIFLAAYTDPPKEIIFDLDATDDPLHGKQEGRYFHGYYGCYCYLPLYIFCGDHLIGTRLRPSNRDAAAGALEEVIRIVDRVRASWPEVRILLRADSGFCRDAIMTWCESNNVEYLFGLARNRRLEERLTSSMVEAKEQYNETGTPSRVFKNFYHRTLDSWSRVRRVVGKAEYLPKGPNPRFVVTSLSRAEVDERRLYEDLYCARGDMENRIKEQQLYLFADRTSSHAFRANQARLYFSSMAYVLMSALRRLGLAGTELARAQCSTIRLKLLKIGTRIRTSVRRVWISYSESYPYVRIFLQALANLGGSPA